MDISRKNPLEDFELLQRIGSGTYGDVYKAKMVGSDTLAAVKVIKIEPDPRLGSASEGSLLMIQYGKKQEILVMKDCKHSNIVRYFGSYLRREKLWIAMEYCGGGSLQDIYHISGPLNEHQIAYVCRETLSGLSYMHNLKKMHRDIKGANILLTDAGDVKLADFGVSAQITATMSKRKSFIGTPYWMAPEVAAVERKGGYDFQCDIWAVGITSIELAELQPPMFDLHPMRALFLMSKSNFVPPKLKDKNKWSSNFHSFVKMCLVKNPKRRPTATTLIKHPFFTESSIPLSKRLTQELLSKAKNANPTSFTGGEDDEDEEERELQNAADLRIRVSSKVTEKNKDRPTSQINVDDLRQAVPVPERAGPNAEEEAESPNYQSSQWPHETRKSLLADVQEELRKRGHETGNLIDRESLPPPPPPPTQAEPRQMQNSDKPPPLPPKQQKPVQSRRLPPVSKGVSTEAPDDERGRQKRMSEAGTAPFLNQDRRSVDENTVQKPGPKPVPPPKPTNGRAPTTNGENIENEDQVPPVVPPRRIRNEFMNKFSDKEQGFSCNGLPPTPKVTMGACFSKIFNECPLIIHCATSWIHPESRDQYILFGCEEGVYTFNMTQIHEGVMDLIFPRKTTWVYVVNNVMMSLSGKNGYIFQHNLIGIIDKNPHKFHMTSRFGEKLQRIPDKLVPRKFALSHKVPDTKGCTKCCIVFNPFNQHKYLCGALPSGVVLLQWYEPMNKFLQIKIFECTLPQEMKVFQMLVKQNAELPIVCVGVARGRDRKYLSFDFINLDSASSWFVEHPPEEKLLNVVCIQQLERDTVLVCFDRDVKVVNLDGKPKPSKRLLSELHFDFVVENLVVLQDSVLAFHKNGMQGRSFRTNEVTQEICDKTKLFTLLGSDKVIVLKSYPTEDPTAPCNIYVLTGHVEMM